MIKCGHVTQIRARDSDEPVFGFKVRPGHARYTPSLQRNVVSCSASLVKNGLTLLHM